ncbi:MAG: YfhO family protein [bacterium]
MFVLLFYALLYLVFFSPILLHGKLLAVGVDAQNLYLPNYYGSKVLWEPLIFGGFPLMADPQVMTWYPPAFLFSLLPGTWNLFVLLAYLAASSLTYGYVYTLTRSRLAGLVSGITFGMSGFMMVHLGHAVIIHSAAWIPLVFWSLEKLRHKVSAGWMIAGSIGIALTFFGGHTQIFAYGLLLSIAYALTMGWNAPIGRWRYYFIAGPVGLLGIGLTGVQLIPTAELARLSARVGYSFADFTVYALPPRQLLTIFFPGLFGVDPESGGIPYFGGENLTEVACYVGLLPLVLSGVSIAKWRPKPLPIFWLCAGLVSLILSMGDATPVARLIYHLPLLSQFRAPGRQIIEFTFAASVLSGLGIACLVQQNLSASFKRKVVFLSCVGVTLAVMVSLAMSGSILQIAAQKSIEVNLTHWIKVGIGVPLLIFVFALTALVYWSKQRDSVWRTIFIVGALVIDLGSFGWFYQWHYSTVAENLGKPPAIAIRYKSLLVPTNQRYLPTQGTLASRNELPPNLSKFWGVPSASGYNSLILGRLNRLLSMTDVGDIKALGWRDPAKQGLNLMAVRYVFSPSDELTDEQLGIEWFQRTENAPTTRPDIVTDEQGIAWYAHDMDVALGSGCNRPQRDSLTLNLPVPVNATAIGLVTAFACSSQIPDGLDVVRVKITAKDGSEEVQSLSAGKDTSEWAYDCAEVTPVMKHRRAPIFSSYPANVGGRPCDGHFYVTKVNLKEPKDITSVELQWIGTSGSIAIEKLSVLNDRTNSSMYLDPSWKKWRFIDEKEGTYVYENLQAMPRAWLAPEVVGLSADQALNAINTSKLPDGRAFDARRTALTEEPISLPAQVDEDSSAKIVTLSNRQMEVQTSSKIPSFLVTSDEYYPGWQVTVDDQQVKLYRADYALRGVVLPAGKHVVKFKYSPRSFVLGLGMSLLSLTALGALALASFSVRKRGTRLGIINLVFADSPADGSFDEPRS